MSNSRRNFLKKSGLLGAGLLASNSIVSAQHQGHVPPQSQAPPKKEVTTNGGAKVPVETPDIPKLNWTSDNGVKVFHLSAEVVKTQLIPGMRA